MKNFGTKIIFLAVAWWGVAQGSNHPGVPAPDEWCINSTRKLLAVAERFDLKLTPTEVIKRIRLTNIPMGIAYSTQDREPDGSTREGYRVVGGRMVVWDIAKPKAPFFEFEVPGGEAGPLGVGAFSFSPFGNWIAMASPANPGMTPAPWLLYDFQRRRALPMQEVLTDGINRIREMLSEVVKLSPPEAVPHEMSAIDPEWAATERFPVSHFQFAPDARRLLVSAWGTFSVRDVDFENKPVRIRPERGINAPLVGGHAWFVDGGQRVLSLHGRQVAYLWNAMDGRIEAAAPMHLPQDFVSDNNSTETAPKADVVAIHAHREEAGRVLARMTLVVRAGMDRGRPMIKPVSFFNYRAPIAFSNDSFVVGTPKGDVQVYDSNTGMLRATYTGGHGGHAVKRVAINAAGDRVISLCQDSLCVWSPGKGAQRLRVTRPIPNGTANVTAMDFAPDGQILMLTTITWPKPTHPRTDVYLLDMSAISSK